MIRKPLTPDDSLENDAVWKLLEHASSTSAGPRFVEDTVRAARLAGQPRPWWIRLCSPAPLAGLATATAALAFSLVLWLGHSSESGSPSAMLDANQAAAIQDLAESETLLAAVDQLDDFSDTELVSLIGF